MPSDSSPQLLTLTKQKTLICRAISAQKKRDAFLAKAQAQGWPTNIRFDELSALVLALKDEILELASDSDELHKNSVWKEFLESIDYQVYKFAAAPDSFQNAKKEAYRGGDFGPQGRSIIAATIEHLISTEISVDQIFQTLASLVDTPHHWDDSDDETKLILETDFVDFILTPHITISLVALELNVPFDEAWTVFQQSDKIGRALHPILHTATPQENSPSPIKHTVNTSECVWPDLTGVRRQYLPPNGLDRHLSPLPISLRAYTVVAIEEAEKVQNSGKLSWLCSLCPKFTPPQEVERSPLEKQKKGVQKTASQKKTAVASPKPTAVKRYSTRSAVHSSS
ncbi:hypothetical protein B0H16DRAFT_1452856 [Mycena metata]|uniref:Restriction of telomere capping protein 4 C-terminal domain-containing protein n=1 Tax=Mycena metata TaxID=1033252 RepID=A0AAD7NNT3_9AGAR|nr:hypothetical protein B0H16DRAFT_1452856 [Mycena metata]